MSWRWWLSALVAFLLVGCRPEPGAVRPVATWHFIGGSNLVATSSGSPLGDLLGDSRAPAVMDRLALRLAESAAAGGVGGGNPELVSRLQPLVSELLKRESLGVLGGEGWWVAARGGEALADLWRPALPGLARPGGDSGNAAPTLVTTNGWVVASAGRVDAREIGEALAGAAPDVLRIELDLGEWIPTRGAEPSRLVLDAGHTNGLVRWQADVTLPDGVLGPLEPWRYPTNQIREPLMMFTAVRGVGPLLARIPWLAKVAGDDLPGQFVSWGQAKVPFRTWVAAPVGEAPGIVRRIHDALLPWFGPDAPDERRAVMGRLGLSSNEMATAILLGQRLEAISPAAGILREGNQNFLQMSLFAPEPSTNRMPDALRDQMSRDRTALYQFELTGESILHWNAMLQLGRIVLGQRPSPTNAPAHGWLLASVPRLGETVTHGELLPEGGLRITRKSPVGFAGAELVALARWLDGPPGRPAVRPPAILPQSPAPSDR